ncbi:MAG: dihydropteroate synthase [Planctomycetales bacterium]|nr:dihydropteroate synthase [Planctomycetales bacterium]
MGILNVTPDSFSDGGKHFVFSQAVDQALRLEDAGADIIDIGGESTRPYSQAVETAEELRRVIPVIEALIPRLSVPISIDTCKSQVAEAALSLGVEIINDVTGLEGDPQMLPVALKSQAAVCVMHMQGNPQTMQDNPTYDRVVDEVYHYLERRRDGLTAAGILADRICMDPGIGFGKTHEHNLDLLRSCQRFLSLGQPLLVGHSRKGFIGKLIGDKQASRTAGTIGISIRLWQSGVQILRVHDVRETADALKCAAAVN